MKRVFETAEREEVRNSIFWELSTVLTVISHSYGESLFFPQPTWRSDTSTDFQAKRLNRHGLMQGCAFCSKNPNFSKCLTPKTGQSITNSYHYPLQQLIRQRLTCDSTLLTLRAYSNTSNMSSWNLSKRLYRPCNRDNTST